MYASSCATLALLAQASIENSPVDLMRSVSFLDAAAVPWALPPVLTLMPQPPTQSTSPDSVRLSAGS